MNAIFNVTQEVIDAFYAEGNAAAFISEGPRAMQNESPDFHKKIEDLIGDHSDNFTEQALFIDTARDLIYTALALVYYAEVLDSRPTITSSLNPMGLK